MYDARQQGDDNNDVCCFFKINFTFFDRLNKNCCRRRIQYVYFYIKAKIFQLCRHFEFLLQEKKNISARG